MNYKYRMHDPRIGRFFAVDPLAASYPHNSPYAFSENRVIDAIELEGAEMLHFTLTWDSPKSKGKLKLIKVDYFDFIAGWFVGVRINGVYTGDRLTMDDAIAAAMGYAAMTRDEYTAHRAEVREADAKAKQEIKDFEATAEEIIETVILAKAGPKVGKLKQKKNQNNNKNKGLAPDVTVGNKVSKQRMEAKGHLNSNKKSGMKNMEDAQEVLDNYNSGKLEVISSNPSNGQVTVRDPSVTGIHRTNGGNTSQNSNIFVIKGQGNSVTIFPKNPNTN